MRMENELVLSQLASWPRFVRCEYAIILLVYATWTVAELLIRIVAASQIKAVELNVQSWLISKSNCFSSCYLHASVGDPLYEWYTMHSTMWIYWVKLTSSWPRVPRILWWSLKDCPLARNERATKLRIADLRRVVALTTEMLLFKLTFFSHIDYTRARTLQLCLVSPNKIEIQFLFHSHSVVDYLHYS